MLTLPMLIDATFRYALRFHDRPLKFAIAMDEINCKGWRINLLHQQDGWKALIYRPSSLLHETGVPKGSDRRAVLEEATALIDSLVET
jgi:hypothetical protein